MTSKDILLVPQILTPKFLDGTVQPAINAAYQKYTPHAQLWVGEAAAAWHSGRDGVTNAFASNFWCAISVFQMPSCCRISAVFLLCLWRKRYSNEASSAFYCGASYTHLSGD